MKRRVLEPPAFCAKNCAPGEKSVTPTDIHAVPEAAAQAHVAVEETTRSVCVRARPTLKGAAASALSCVRPMVVEGPSARITSRCVDDGCQGGISAAAEGTAEEVGGSGKESGNVASGGGCVGSSISLLRVCTFSPARLHTVVASERSARALIAIPCFIFLRLYRCSYLFSFSFFFRASLSLLSGSHPHISTSQRHPRRPREQTAVNRSGGERGDLSLHPGLHPL